jgi:HEAT repeat protein
LRGAILARGSQGLPLLVEQLKSEDKKKLGIGLRTARELHGQDVTEALAKEMGQLNSDRRPLLLLALSDRSDSAVLPIILKAAGSGARDLRLTAIDILVRLGNASCVPVLLEAATGTDAQVARAAKETLIRIPDKAVDTDVVARLRNAQGPSKQVLIEVAGQRQITEAIGAVVASLKDGDADTRAAAVRAIGIIGQAPQAGDLVTVLQVTRGASERGAMRTALQAIAGRGGAACLPALMALSQSRDNDLRVIGLQAMVPVGGSEALGAVKYAIANGEAPVQDEAVRILSTWPNSWPDDGEAGKALLALASSSTKMSHQVLGLRGYLQYLRGSKALDNEQKVAEVKTLLTHIKRPEETRQAIAVLGESPCASALDLLTTLATDASVAEEAYSAMVVLTSQNVSGVDKDRRKQVLETVIETSKNDGTKQRASRALRGIR